MMKKRAFARRPDPGDFLQASLADVALAPGPMRADGELMRLVAQPLDEIEQGIARRQPEWLAAGYEEGLASGIAVETLGDRGKRNALNAERLERLARGIQLALAAVDQHQVRPGRNRIFVVGDLLFARSKFLSPPLRERAGEGGNFQIWNLSLTPLPPVFAFSFDGRPPPQGGR